MQRWCSELSTVARKVEADLRLRHATLALPPAVRGVKQSALLSPSPKVMATSSIRKYVVHDIQSFPLLHVNTKSTSEVTVNQSWLPRHPCHMRSGRAGDEREDKGARVLEAFEPSEKERQNEECHQNSASCKEDISCHLKTLESFTNAQSQSCKYASAPHIACVPEIQAFVNPHTPAYSSDFRAPYNSITENISSRFPRHRHYSA